MKRFLILAVMSLSLSACGDSNKDHKKEPKVDGTPVVVESPDVGVATPSPSPVGKPSPVATPAAPVPSAGDPDRDKFFSEIKPHLANTTLHQPVVSSLEQADCGKTVELTGKIDGFKFQKSCDPANPVMIKAKGASFTGTVEVSGKGIVVMGLDFKGPNAVITSGNCESCAFKRNSFDGPSSQAIHARGKWLEISYNEIKNFKIQGIEVSLKKGEDSYGAWIHHNYIHDTAGVAGNGHEAIRILTNAFEDAHGLIEKNLMQNVWVAGEDEAISVKAAGCMVYGNTLIDPKAGFTARETNRTVFMENHLEQAKWFNVMGDNNKYIRNSGKMNLRAGNQTMDGPRCKSGKPVVCVSADSDTGAYTAARKTIIKDHKGDVLVGDKRKDNETFPASDTVIESMTGKMTKGLEKNTVLKAAAGNGAKVPVLTAADVGVNAK